MMGVSFIEIFGYLSLAKSPSPILSGVMFLDSLAVNCLIDFTVRREENDCVDF